MRSPTSLRTLSEEPFRPGSSTSNGTRFLSSISTLRRGSDTSVPLEEEKQRITKRWYIEEGSRRKKDVRVLLFALVLFRFEPSSTGSRVENVLPFVDASHRGTFQELRSTKHNKKKETFVADASSHAEGKEEQEWKQIVGSWKSRRSYLLLFPLHLQ